ncbi:ATP-binding protein [Allonocardiopsis opalescens]|uniref:Tfp pilus assembly protein PilF n=1 Tax=Allonocardiopsis opalescens TaxID=1144618 RepID=A0A2T0PXJ9_9ACTN|nr:tetratricopeptide repeat protein [Allonocardiopsis opalescens]PRX96260.1 Tfp pilus assembly protein PilF [Allonocardiopsis opalescens]
MASPHHESHDQDPALRPDAPPAPAAPPVTDNRVSGTTAGHVVQAGAIHGDVYLSAPTGPPHRPVPYQLPPDPAHFTDRRTELDALDGAAGAPAVLVGVGGVGKTALGIHFLTRRRDRLPDGQLYIDLRGFPPGDPVDPGEALDSFLRALGVPPDAVPPGLAARSALFRSVTHGRGLGLLLDNAVSAAQVRPLLPGPGTHLVVVTSRRRIAGLRLDGARFVDVPPLTRTAAVRLLDRLVDDERTGVDPQAADDLAELCGGLPIALRAVAGQLAQRPSRTIGRMVADLHRERTRLGALTADPDDTEEIPVRATFDSSYDALPPDAARLYRLLGLHPGPDTDIPAAAALADLPPDTTGDLLDTLATASLLESPTSGRYRFHDLLRLHATEKAEAHDTPTARAAAVDRVLGYYLDALVAADLVVRPYSDRSTGAPPPAHPRRFAGSAEALEWLEAERHNVRALVRFAADSGRPAAACELADGLWPLLLYRRHYPLWLEVDERAIAAARDLGDERVEADMLSRLGLAYLSMGDHRAADERFRAALDIRNRIGDRAAIADLVHRRGLAALRDDRPDDAIRHLRTALAIDEELGRARNQALTLLELGRAMYGAERHAEAGAVLERALDLIDGAADPYNRARIEVMLGRVLAESDRAAAEERLGGALVVMAELNSLPGLAEAHEALGDLARRAGRLEQAAAHYAQALTASERLGRSVAVERISARLAGLGH